MPHSAIRLFRGSMAAQVKDCGRGYIKSENIKRPRKYGGAGQKLRPRIHKKRKIKRPRKYGGAGQKLRSRIHKSEKIKRPREYGGAGQKLRSRIHKKAKISNVRGSMAAQVKNCGRVYIKSENIKRPRKYGGAGQKLRSRICHRALPGGYHSNTSAPLERPPPNAVRRIFCPLWSIPFLFISSSAIGMLAPDTLPKRSMFTYHFSRSIPDFG